jgi:hypothetical protein
VLLMCVISTLNSSELPGCVTFCRIQMNCFSQTQNFKVCRPSSATCFGSTNRHQALIDKNFRNVSTLAVRIVG